MKEWRLHTLTGKTTLPPESIQNQTIVEKLASKREQDQNNRGNVRFLEFLCFFLSLIWTNYLLGGNTVSITLITLFETGEVGEENQSINFPSPSITYL